MTEPSLLRNGRFARLTGRRKSLYRRVRVGKREVLTHGIRKSVWNDAFHSAMTASWPVFLGGLAAVFVLINAAFAVLYALQPDSVANTKGVLLELFFFSVETLTTVGYGEFYPQTDYAHGVVSVETFLGLFFSASMLGLIFARVSRPRARLIFSRHLVIGRYDGQRVLTVRVANARLNMIGSATARIWLMVDQATLEKVSFRRFLELKLLRSENPIFTLSWTIFHVIDETSPLHGLTPQDLDAMDAFLIVGISGLDETAGQTVQARETYSYGDIKWEHGFVDILERTEDGMSLLNYDRFHEVEPLAAELIAGEVAPDKK